MTIYKTSRDARDAAARRQSSKFPADPGRYLVGRFGFGTHRPDPLSNNPDAWLKDQIAKGKALSGYKAIPELKKTFPCLELDPPATRAWLKANVNNEWSLESTVQLEYATLALQAWSQAQLYEAVVDVMSNHLNVTNGRFDTWCARTSYDRDVIRANAFGSFENMLVASAKHPAMLIYLNAAMSSNGALNENYGRELLELHTVGIEAGYSQTDVINVARLMTGRTVEYSKTVYLNNWKLHYTGPIKVLGFATSNADIRGGEKAGDALLRYLARHPSTARNLARKFCVRFVSDSPSSALINAVASAYLANGTSFLAMIDVILRSDEFWLAAGAKLRRPAENVVATVRVTRTRPGNDLRAAAKVLSDASANAGHRVLAWQAPNGYPDVTSAWNTSGGLVANWQFQYDLLNGAYPQLQVPDVGWTLSALGPQTVADSHAQVWGSLIGGVIPANAKSALSAFLNEPATRSYAASTQSKSLAAVAALVLHGPDHANR